MDTFKIGGLQKESLIDWDGMLSAVIFTQGCNFRCGYCHNPSLVIPQLIKDLNRIPVDQVLNYLSSRKGWIDGVVITGGEPTIQTGLVSFITEVKRLEYPVKLDTNGTNPVVLEYLIEKKMVDYIAMDIKSLPVFHRYQEVTPITAEIFKLVVQSITLLRKNRVPYEFRTTQVPFVHSEHDISELKNFLGDQTPYRVQPFKEADTVAGYLSITPS